MRWPLAAILLFSAIVYISNFPVIPRFLLIICIGYVALLWIKPTAWLLILPLMVPILDLAPWSGRLLLDEFDILVVLTVAIVLVRNRHESFARGFGLNAKFWLIVFLLLSSYVISFIFGFLPLQSLDGNAWSGYFTRWNALRLGKGFVEGIILVLLLARQRADSPEKVDLLLLRGLVAGLFCFGLVVLWERGVFSDLAHASNIYDALAGLLDFSTRYRITGLFSQMHMGGSAVDGYLVLCSIFPLVLFLKSADWKESGWALLVSSLTMYAVLVTFTRGTYFAVGVAFFVFLGLLYIRALKDDAPGARTWLLTLGLALLALIVMILGFRRGGSITLFAMGMAILAGGGVVLMQEYPSGRIRWSALCVMVALVGFLSVRGIVTSKYTNVGLVEAIFVGAIGSAVLVLGSYGVFRLLCRSAPLRANVSALLALVLGLPVMVIGFSNTRMEVRFDQVGQDFETRLGHWENGFELMSDNIGAQLFGIGLGSFSRSYLLGNREEKPTGYVWLDQDEKGAYLRVVGGGTALGQRIRSDINNPLTFSFLMRPELGNGSIRFRVCQRPLLVQNEGGWIPHCSSTKSIRVHSENEWKFYQVEFDSHEFPHLRWYMPNFTMLSIESTSNSIIEIRDLRLVDGDGRYLLENGDFSSGLDNWLIFSDFEHLPWHAKNLYLHIYLEQGLWGLLTFIGLVCLSIGLAWRQVMQGNLLAMGIIAAQIGFLGLGLVATLFDVPRLVMLFYLTIFWPILQAWHGPKPFSSGRKHRSRKHRAELMVKTTES